MQNIACTATKALAQRMTQPSRTHHHDGIFEQHHGIDTTKATQQACRSSQNKCAGRLTILNFSSSTIECRSNSAACLSDTIGSHTTINIPMNHTAIYLASIFRSGNSSRPRSSIALIMSSSLFLMRTSLVRAAGSAILLTQENDASKMSPRKRLPGKLCLQWW